MLVVDVRCDLRPGRTERKSCRRPVGQFLQQFLHHLPPGQPAGQQYQARQQQYQLQAAQRRFHQSMEFVAGSQNHHHDHDGNGNDRDDDHVHHVGILHRHGDHHRTADRHFDADQEDDGHRHSGRHVLSRPGNRIEEDQLERDPKQDRGDYEAIRRSCVSFFLISILVPFKN